MKVSAIVTGALLISAGVFAQAQVPPPPQGEPVNAPPPKSVAMGPYTVTVATDPSLPTHTIYRPTDLSAVKGTLPIIAWGNGGCIAAGRAFENFLTKVASHGFFVVAIGPYDSKLPNLADLKPGQPMPPLTPDMVSKSPQLIEGVNWAIAQNDKKDGPFAKKLNTQAIGIMGQSCGGTQTIIVSKDPRVKTSVIWNSGMFNTPNPRVEGTKDDLKGLHAPVAYFIGGPTDIAYANAEDDFTKIDKVPVFNANLNVGHGGTFRQPNGGWFGEVGVAWLQWQLQGNKDAAKMFEGEKCGLCVESAWTVKKKNMR
jgi:hypothetical protein